LMVEMGAMWVIGLKLEAQTACMRGQSRV